MSKEDKLTQPKTSKKTQHKAENETAIVMDKKGSASPIVADNNPALSLRGKQRTLKLFTGLAVLSALLALTISGYQFLQLRKVQAQLNKINASQQALTINQAAYQKALQGQAQQLAQQANRLSQLEDEKHNAPQVVNAKWLSAARVSLAQLTLAQVQNLVAQQAPKAQLTSRLNLFYQTILSLSEEQKDLLMANLKPLRAEVEALPEMANAQIWQSLQTVKTQLGQLAFKTPENVVNSARNLPASPEVTGWKENMRAGWEKLKHLIVIQHGQDLNQILLSNQAKAHASALFMSEINRLETSLLLRSQPLYHNTLQALMDSIQHYSVSDAIQTKVLAQLQNLSQAVIAYPASQLALVDAHLQALAKQLQAIQFPALLLNNTKALSASAKGGSE